MKNLKKVLAAARKPKPRSRPVPMPKPSATAWPVTPRAKTKAKKGAATVKANPKLKPKPNKMVQIKGPGRSQRVSERALDTESTDLEIDEGLAMHRRKLTRRCQRKASDDGSWASKCSC